MKAIDRVRRLALACILTLTAAMSIALASPDGWNCEAGTCTATAKFAVATLTGSFDHGANLSRTSQVDRVAELEQQRWREFKFVVAEPARIYVRAQVDKAYAPADWPADISLADVGVGVSRHFSLDGEAYKKIDDGFILPSGAFLSIVVAQETDGNDTDIATFYPARYSVDVFARRVADEADLLDIDLTTIPILSEDDAAALGMPGEPSNDLDAAIDTALGGCASADCRQSDAQLSATLGEGSQAQDDPVDPNAVDFATSDDATLAGDSMAGDCSQDQAECRPNDGAPANANDNASSAPDPLAAELQTELARVGCYEAMIDGLWGPASRRALRNFNHWNGADLPVETPTPKALVTVARVTNPVCGVD